MIASSPKRVGVMKCATCRHHRQKCIPADSEITERTWIVGGQQDKCMRCDRLGQRCGPPQYPLSADQAGPRSPTSTFQNRRASEGGQVIFQESALAPAHNGLGVAGPSLVLSDDTVALQHRMREIDLRAEALAKLEEDILRIDLTAGDYDNQTRFNNLIAIKDAILSKLLDLLRLAKHLAICVEQAGHHLQAYMAYARVLEVYHKRDMPASYEIRTMLFSMAKILWVMGDDYRAQTLAWQALMSCDSVSKAQPSDLEVLKAIAKSLLRTSPEISQIIQAEMLGHVVYDCSSVLPPLHAMIESSYASQVSGNVLQSGLHTDVNRENSAEIPMVGGIDAVVEFLSVFPDTHLERRDSHKRSPLLLAIARCKEGLGLGLMIRTHHNPRLLQRLVNARDESGQTVLSMAIEEKSSLHFITTLIDNGAEVKPQAVQLASTPLQAACSRGSFEIVDLLLRKGANADSAFPGSNMPLAIAEELGHFDIIDRLTSSSPGSMSSHTVREDDYGG